MEILSILMVAVTVEALTEWVKALKKDWGCLTLISAVNMLNSKNESN